MSSTYSLPHLKEIIILSTNYERTVELLSPVDNSKSPYLINLYSLGDIDIDFILMIENLLKENCPDLNLPYPIYMLTKDYYPQLTIENFQQHKDIPRFYQKKDIATHKLSTKVQRERMMAYDSVKEVDIIEAKLQLSRYKNDNRKIYELNYTLNRYQEIIQRIENAMRDEDE